MNKLNKVTGNKKNDVTKKGSRLSAMVFAQSGTV